MSFTPPKYGEAYTFYMSLVSRASRPQFQASPTLASGDVKIAIDDGAPANLATLPTVDGDFTKQIKVSLSADEMEGNNIRVLFSDQAGDEWDDISVLIQPSPLQLEDLPDALLDHTAGIETGYTVRGGLRVMLSALAGKLAKSGDIVTIRDMADSKNRITATTDSNGQRTAVSRDAS